MTDHSAELTTVLNQPAQEYGFVAMDHAARGYMRPSVDLLRDAATDFLMARAISSLPENAETVDRVRAVNRAEALLKAGLTDRDENRGLQTMIPGAVWYEINANHRQMQMIVCGKAVWVAECDGDGRAVRGYQTKRLTKDEAYATICQSEPA